MSQTILKEGLGYEGKVTLTLKSNGRILESKTYKNTGTAQLFNFLAYCLADDYQRARDLLPSKIMLLYNGQTPDSRYATSVVQRSSYQGLAQVPTIITTNQAQASVVYSFEVPKAAITGEFNQVALYNGNATYTENGIKNFSAYYFLVDGDKSKFNTQSTQDWSPSTVLLIEWELIISNKNEVLSREEEA